MTKPSILVHHLDHSRSQRILWLLEELELPYEVKLWRRDPKTWRAPAGLREVHPLGKAPVVQVGETTLAESGAIIENLLDRFGEGRLRPSEPEALARFRYWMHFAEGSLTTPLLVKLITTRLRTKAPLLARPLTGAIAGQIDGTFTDAEIDRLFGFVDAHLASNPHMCGETFTAADIQMSYPLEAGMERVGGVRPAISDWIGRMKARDAYQRAEAKGTFD